MIILPRQARDKLGKALKSTGVSLGRWTILTTSLDVNTDSNTRQRDNCMIDAYLCYSGQYIALLI
jgi:hypothetical protein